MTRTLCLIAAGLLMAGSTAGAQQPTPAAAPAAAKTDSTKADSAKKLTPEQLQSMVAPIALYPDDLLTNCLVAATYPLEIVALQQYLAKHPELKDKALADSVAKQSWDPSIQSLAALPDAVKRLAEDIQWTTELGNAFLAQQKELMDAVQVMRKKAKDKGALESNEQQKVETKVVEKTEVIVVQSANPEVVYVPSYSPTVVYGAPVYPYPPIYYPYYPPGAAFVSFSVGMMWGAAMWGGACCRYGWGGGGNVYINHNNNFNNINVNNRNNINSGNRGGNNWQHNPSHRGGAPYGDRATNNKYGGDRAGNRASGTGQRGTGASDRSASGNRAGTGAGVSDRSASGNRAGAGGSGGLGGSDKIGNQSIPSDAGSRAGASDRSSSGNRSGGGGGGGFGGGSGGYDGASARASSSRGASSMGGRSGGGYSRGGGGGGRRR
jgi:hypothetical protein